MTQQTKNTKFQSIKGFYDILPEMTPLWQKLEDTARQVLSQYGYRNIRMPIVEPTELFIRSVGEHTDIVEKEMYSWEDALNGDKLTLRPEGTAGCVRAVVEHSLTYNGPQRLWYTGPMFRHENVQKGRQRQFHQIGVEAFGFDGPDVDAEQIILLSRLWKALGIADVELQLNSIGDADERAEFRKSLIAYFEQHADLLDEDAKRRLHSNPLRILDSKNPRMQDMIEGAPKLIDHLGDETRAHFVGLCNRLDAVGIAYKLNPRLVRGLDYYNRTVFEWVTDQLGSQGTVCGGGRYDYLIEQVGGKPAPAVGWALGIERVLALLEEQGTALPSAVPHAYAIVPEVQNLPEVLKHLRQLRALGVNVQMHAGTGEGIGSMKSQFKKADSSGAHFALIFGVDELAQNMVSVKSLRDGGGAQRTESLENLGALAQSLQLTP